MAVSRGGSGRPGRRFVQTNELNPIFGVTHGDSKKSRAGLDTLWSSLGPSERRTLAMMVFVIAALHAIGFGILLFVVAPHHYALGDASAFTTGLGLTAYTLGMRHALDADHIAAIDNTTRKLMAEGKRPLSVGFWFSLGHSTVVFGLAFLLSIGIRSLGAPIRDQSSGLHELAGSTGTLASGVFLYAIGILNLVVLIGIVQVFRRMRQGRIDEQALERQLEHRGVMNRYLGRFTRSVRTPGQMYPLGILFGLGFDTATEIALLVLAGGAAGAGLPWYAILCLPVLFAAGMALLDSIDGSFMNFAYGWAFAKPVRKIYYNLTVTGLSVVVALLIGTIELGGLLASRLDLSGSFWIWLENIDLNTIGFVITALFVATWALALLVWRYGRIEERWGTQIPQSESSRIG